MNLDNEKLAALFDTMAETLIAVAGTFRAATDSGAPAKVDAKTAKPRAAKAKPTKDAEPSEVTVDDVRDALQAVVESHGNAVMRAVLKSVAKVDILGDADEADYPALLKAAKAKAAEDPEGEEEEAPKTAPAKKTAKAKGPTLDDVKAAAIRLRDADAAAFDKVTKRIGKPSAMDPDAYASAISTYESLMPSDDEDGDL